MFEFLKSKLYFPIASYFRFFATIRLRMWKPRVIVVTGSSGKTTLLHLLEAQLGKKARFSHHANSSYGIPFDILDLHRKSLKTSEWVSLFLRAPLQTFTKFPKEAIYVVEADTDRAGEGKFLAELLRPEVVLWLNASRTHGMNFDHLVREGIFGSVDEAIAYDFGYLLAYCQKLAVINGDMPLMRDQITRTKADVKQITKADDLDKYTIEKDKTVFTINAEKYAFPALLPEEVFYSLAICKATVDHLQLPFDNSFNHFILPPGRSTILQGVKATYLIDSSYNANLISMQAILGMFAKIHVEKKWVVLGDMLEIGEKEQEEHEILGEVLAEMALDKIILVGKRVQKYTYPLLRGKLSNHDDKIICFEKHRDALDYVREHLKGSETILFKGSQSIFLEGIIEALLTDKEDAKKLPRREAFWGKKRKVLYG